MARRKRRTPHLAYLHRSVGVSVDEPKTAAIFFDKILTCSEKISDGPSKLIARVLCPVSLPSPGGLDVPNQTTINVNFVLKSGDKRSFMGHLTREGLWATMHKDPGRIVDALGAQGLRPALCYRDPADFGSAFEGGDHGEMVATVSGLHLVDEDRLTWEQVIALREDQASRARVIRFTRWFHRVFNGSSHAKIEDDLLKMHEMYERSLSKFGIAMRAAGRAATTITAAEVKNLGVGGGALLGGSSIAEKPLAGAAVASLLCVGNFVFRFHKAHKRLKGERDAMAFLTDICDANSIERDLNDWGW